MRIGLVFPRSEIGADAGAIREFAQAADQMGFSHISIEEHVLGVDPNREGGWDLGPFGPGSGGHITRDTPFSEPLVLAGFLAGVTKRIEMSTAILILPQRPAALVAKQAAELANLSEGRFRLGIGAGWNPVEFEGLGAEFQRRGKRQEEQVQVMRQLWSQEVVDFRGRWHRIDKAGINPLPRYDIPVWFGGGADAVLRRAARLGDGWIPLGLTPDEEGRAAVARMGGYLRDAGREPRDFGIEVFFRVQGQSPETLRDELERYMAIGVTHVSALLSGPGAGGPETLIARMQAWRDTLFDFMVPPAS